jgi:hypothetical protein
MKGQKRGSYWVVCGKKVLLKTRDIGSARAFQNGLGWPDAKVVAVRVVWNSPLVESVPDARRWDGEIAGARDGREGAVMTSRKRGRARL